MSRIRTSATVLLLAASLAACGGSDEPETPEPSDAPSSSAAPSESASDDPADLAAYLPAPSGVTLTEPGTELGLRDEAVAAWAPRQDVVGVVEVEVTRIERTSVKESLAGFDLPPGTQGATPYFVSTWVTNVGETDLGGRQLPLYAVDSDQALVAPTGVAPGFDACPGSTLPAVFAPDDSARSCVIFLVPAGARLTSVMFRPPEGVVPITWAGEVTELSERGGKKGEGKKGAGKQDEDQPADG